MRNLDLIVSGSGCMQEEVVSLLQQSVSVDEECRSMVADCFAAIALINLERQHL
jgi:hypothetical protein